MYCELSDVTFDYIGSISNLAMLLNHKERYDEAYRLINEANRLMDEYDFNHPFSKYIRLHLAEVMINKGQLEPASELLDQYAHHDPSGYGYELMGDIAFKKSEYDEAIKYYHKALEGEDIPYYFVDAVSKTAKIYELKGNYYKSNEYLKKCIKLYKEITPNMI